MVRITMEGQQPEPANPTGIIYRPGAFDNTARSVADALRRYDTGAAQRGMVNETAIQAAALLGAQSGSEFTVPQAVLDAFADKTARLIARGGNFPHQYGALVPQPSLAARLGPAIQQIQMHVTPSGPTLYGVRGGAPMGEARYGALVPAGPRIDHGAPWLDYLEGMRRQNRTLDDILKVERHIDSSNAFAPWAKPGGQWFMAGGGTATAGGRYTPPPPAGMPGGPPIGPVFGGIGGPPPGGGGGAGGGGAGGGGAGGGGAGGGGRPFHLGTLARSPAGLVGQLGRSLRRLGPAGAAAGMTLEFAAAAHDAIVDFPAEFQRALLDKSRMALDYKLWAYRQQQASGDWQNIEGLFYPGVNEFSKIPAWMRATGTGPQDIARSLMQFGVVPQPGETEGVASALAAAPFFPGIGNVPGAGGYISHMAKLGMMPATGEGVRGFTLQFSEIMEGAVAKGVDRATLMESVAKGIDRLAGGGAQGMTQGAVADFLMRYSALPGGKSGALGIQALAGTEGVKAELGAQPLGTMVFSMAAQKLNTREKLSSFFEGLPGGRGKGYLERFTQTASGSQAVEMYLESVRKGNWYGAARWLGEIAIGAPGAYEQMASMSPMFAGIPREMLPFALSGFLKQPVMTFLEGQANPSGGAFGHFMHSADWNGPTTRFKPWMMAPSNPLDSGSPSLYSAGISRLGIKEYLIPKIIQYAQAAGIDPRLLAAIVRKESSGGRTTQNVAGLDPTIWGRIGVEVHDPDTSLRLGAQTLAKLLRRFGGNVQQAIEAYNGQPTKAAYGAEVMQYASQAGYGGGGGMPQELQEGLGVQSQTALAEMSQSVIYLHEMNTVVPVLNEGLGVLTGTVKAVTRAFIGMYHAMTGSTTGQTGGHN